MAHDDGPNHRVFNLRGRDVHSFQVQPQHLDTGTGTNQGVRNHVNGPAQVPGQVGFSWQVGDQGGSGEFQNAPSNNGRWQAGHLLARQNGGLGNVNEMVFPQNGQINMGNSYQGQPTFDQWRGHEQQFHNQVDQQQTQGNWSVTLRDQPRTPYQNQPYDPSYWPQHWNQ